jgi:plasmid stabilization system protein ParE
MIVTFRPEAEADLDDAARWYEHCRAGLGLSFLDEVLNTVGEISENPHQYARVHNEIRRAMTRRFPFGIFYRVETECVVVFAVMHASRDPAQWKERT